MRVGSLFAGIGGFDLAAERAGMEVVWQSENDPHASRVLDFHWPAVKNYGDIHEIKPAPGVDVLTGGFPCQDYSVAGNRGGLAGDRGALWWEYHRLIARLRPAWVIGENVPGLLSSRDGQDFETIVGSLTELGYGVAWAVLDAQYFGVAQRRRRVFIVGHSGGRPRPEVLALGQGVFGHPPPSREKGEAAAPSLAARTRGGGGLGTDTELDGGLIPSVTPALTAKLAKGTGGPAGDEGGHLISFRSNAGNRLVDELRDLAPPLTIGGAGANPPAVMAIQDTTRMAKDQNGVGVSEEDVGYTLDGQSRPGVAAISENLRGEVLETEYVRSLNTSGGKPGQGYPAARIGAQVRRLTPLECERLQGFPDGWTDVPGASDTQRYRQLGNAVAVPVVEWLLKRIGEA